MKSFINSYLNRITQILRLALVMLLMFSGLTVFGQSKPQDDKSNSNTTPATNPSSPQMVPTQGNPTQRPQPMPGTPPPNSKVATMMKAETDSIRAMLNRSAAAWSAGNLNGFMSAYLNTDSLIFVSKHGVTYGYKKILENYKKNYPTPEQMGKLKFDVIRVDMINPMHAIAIGKYNLKRKDKDGKDLEESGHFTLRLMKNPALRRWVITMDHSS